MNATLPAAALASRSSFEDWAKSIVRSSPTLPVIFGSVAVQLDDEDTSVAPHLASDGFWESWVSIAIGRRVTPGMRCLDVGAKHGYYKALMRVQCGESGRVWAVEANRRMASLIAQTIRANQWENVAVIPDAVGETNGPGILYVADDRAANGSLIEALSGGGVPTYCECRTFDSIVDEIGRVDFVKIDIEGSEEVLWHFGRLSLARIPVIVMEVRAGRYTRPAAFLANIRRLFPSLRAIDYQGQIVPVTDEQILGNQDDFMLWLER